MPSNLKTSQEWLKLKPLIMLLDPDGWNRTNFQYSFYEEKITQEEFDKRLSYSTSLTNAK